MPLTVALADGILQDHYIGPLNTQLQNEAIPYTFFGESTHKWNGRQCVFPVRVGRNVGTGVSAGGNLPAVAGNQGTLDLFLRAKQAYGRFEVEGAAMAATDGPSSFIGWADLEMDGLKDDLIALLSRFAVTGGRVIGFLNEHVAHAAVTAGAQAVANAIATTNERDWQFSGDYTFIAGAVAVNPIDHLTWVPVRLVRMDTFAEIVGAAPATDNIFISAAGQPWQDAGTVQIRFGQNAAGPGPSFTTVPVAAGFGIAVVLDARPAVDSGGPPLPMGIVPGTIGGAAPAGGGSWPNGAYTALQAVAPAARVGIATRVERHEPLGIFDLMAHPDYFTRNRSTAAPTVVGADLLQGWVLTGNTAGTHARVNLTTTRMQQVFDQLQQASNVKPSVIWMNYLQRSSYQALLIGTMHTSTTKAEKGDGGFSMNENGVEFSFNGVPIVGTQFVPRGMLLFLSKKTWKRADLSKGKFADENGRVLEKRMGAAGGGVDSYEGFWRAYYDCFCTRPNANAILTGVNF